MDKARSLHHRHLQRHKPSNSSSSSNNSHSPSRSSDRSSVRKRYVTMSKLSPSLKALINAPFARPGPAPAPAKIGDIYAAIAREAAQKKIGARPWIALATAASFTMNSPDSISALYTVASSASSSSSSPPTNPVQTAEFMREVGLKCISFNGIPRTINCLNAFHASLPSDVTAQLSTTPSRAVTAQNLDAVTKRGRALWDSVYAPFEDKLYAKLAQSHPDMPVHILHSHYGPLLSDPTPEEKGSLGSVGRVLTSVVAIACLRAQSGVAPQVLSHVFGLRKAVVGDGSYRADTLTEEEKRGAEWLATDEGGEWLLGSVDRIAAAIGGGEGSNFAPRPAGRESKL